MRRVTIVCDIYEGEFVTETSDAIITQDIAAELEGLPVGMDSVLAFVSAEITP